MTPRTAVPASPPAAPARGGAVIESIAFVTQADDARPVVVGFPEARVRALLANSRPVDAAGADTAAATADLALLVLPAAADDTAGIPPDALAWVEAAGPAQAIALHGAAVAWAPGRAAVLVEPARLGAVRSAVVECCFHERELRAVEEAVAAAWPDAEADTALAFEFHDRDADRRQALGERFRRTVSLRARLARLAPHLDRPPPHPPTLAGQVGERMRERGRMADRAASLAERLEVQERVYELCGQRVSDWALARRSRTLEWAIVVLLAIETVLILVDLLGSRGT